MTVLPESVLLVDGRFEAAGRVLAMTDAAYSFLAARLGACPFGGGRQVFVVDCAEGDAPDLPAGSSGNPALLGLNLDHPPVQNCIQQENGAPHLGVALHEMGHNFWYACPRHWETMHGHEHGDDEVRWNEGFATHLSQLWQRHLETCPPEAGVPRLWAGYVEEEGYDGSLAANRKGFLAALARYEEDGRGYAACDPDVVDGILIRLGDEYGWEHYDRWLGCWYPRYPLPMPTSTPARRASRELRRRGE